MDKFKALQIYYNQNQKEYLYDHKCIEPFYNEIPDKFRFEDGYFLLENKVILDNIEKLDAEYVAVWSWRHFDKITGYSQDGSYQKSLGKEALVDWLILTLENESPDIVGFHRHLNKYHKLHLLTMADRFHPVSHKPKVTFTDVLKILLNQAGIKNIRLNKEFDFVTLMNYQVVKKDLYLRYIEEMLRPVINVMMDKDNKELQPYLFSDSNYKGSAKNEGTLMKIGGQPHYTMHSFLLERLFTIWMNGKGFKFINY